EGEVIGYASSFLIGADKAFAPHDWRSISGNGYAALHDPNGNYVYGLEVSVDPDFRGQRIGQLCIADDQPRLLFFDRAHETDPTSWRFYLELAST
ncbi:MAG: hypothetical protein R3360_07730, partial [Alphaproteobacteria bacterium]|nr:hypothetical protein [Alphaproteobacteria bacterium]